MGEFIEIRVRRFFANDDVDIAPSASFLTDSEKAAELIGQSIHNMVPYLDKQVEGMPLEGVRPMTREEIDRYRRDEDDES